MLQIDNVNRVINSNNADLGSKTNSDDRANNGQTATSSDPVDLATGNFFTKYEDIAIEGFNPIRFERYYSCQNTCTGDFDGKLVLILDAKDNRTYTI